MRKSILFSLLLPVALASCDSVTDPNGPLQVSLSVDRTVVSSSQPVEMTVELVNHGARTVETVPAAAYGCVRPFAIVDAQGDTLTLPQRACALISYAPLRLAPGERVTIRDRWDADRSGGDFSAIPVAPGSYRIVARVFGDGRELHSAPVALTVVGAGALQAGAAR